MALFMPAGVRRLHLSDECDRAEHLGRERLMKHHRLGVLDRIFTCSHGDIQVLQLQAQTITFLRLLLFILSARRTIAEPSLLIGPQPVAFSCFRSLSLVKPQRHSGVRAALQAGLTSGV